MKEMWNLIQIVFAALGGWVGHFLGGWDGPLYALVTFITIDYASGVMCAIVDRQLSSEVGFRGICKKIVILVLVGIGSILDSQIVGSGGVIRTAVIFYYLSNEGVSILENAARLDLPIPEKLKNVLTQLKEESEDE